MPSRKMTTLPFGIFTVLCTLANVPTLCRSAAAGSSIRGSSCATTPRYLSSSERELTRASELSRPTVSGRMAPGNRTVSRTGRIGKVSGTTLRLSAMGSSVRPGGKKPKSRETLDAGGARTVHSYAFYLHKILVNGTHIPAYVAKFCEALH